jgi:uncharacterized protein with FMN-binding domain
MKKFITSASLVVAFSFYALYQRMGSVVYVSTNQDSINNTINTTPNAGSTNPIASKNPILSPISTIPQPSPKPTVITQKLGYKDGVYTGNVADAYYGYVQVQATIQSGQVTDVKFLNYPQDRRTSIEINTQAMPILQTEAIQSQSAQVNSVSGASDTSSAFRESLTNALNQAKV